MMIKFDKAAKDTNVFFSHALPRMTLICFIFDGFSSSQYLDLLKGFISNLSPQYFGRFYTLVNGELNDDNAQTSWYWEEKVVCSNWHRDLLYIPTYNVVNHVVYTPAKKIFTSLKSIKVLSKFMKFFIYFLQNFAIFVRVFNITETYWKYIHFNQLKNLIGTI